MAKRVERVEAALPHHRHSALWEPERSEPGLLDQCRSGSEITPVQLGVGFTDRPHPFRCDAIVLALGQCPGQPQLACLQQRAGGGPDDTGSMCC